MPDTLCHHALVLLDKLLQQEKGKRRIKNSEAFLTTKASNPDWNLRPESWAPDWCQGWAFSPGYAFAEALGIELTVRVRTETLKDSFGNPVPETDKNGKPKISKGKPVYQKIKYRYYTWTQSTSFDFRAGYMIHSTPNIPDQCWKEQLLHTTASVQVIDAMPASSGSAQIDRDPGFVTFKLYRHSETDNKVCTELHTVTQEDFVRLLITGEVRKDIAEIQANA